MSAAHGWRVAVVGATGMVGETLLGIMQERRAPIGSLRLFATSRTAGSAVRAFGREWIVEDLETSEAPFEGIDVAFFAGSDDASKRYAKSLAERALVIDKSSTYRLDAAVPLVVPEVNGALIRRTGLIANPNCSTIPLAVVLGPVDREFGLSWVSVSTYQSVSGAGKDAVDELAAQLRGADAVRALPQRIAGNVFPEVGGFDEDGYSGEESKIAAELRKILARPDLPVSATTVRVPVKVGHSEAVAFATSRAADRSEIARLFASQAGVRFAEGTRYATPLEVAGSDDVHVGRLRQDRAHAGAYLCWIVCDNLRKGAATNALQIAEIAMTKTAAPA